MRKRKEDHLIQLAFGELNDPKDGFAASEDEAKALREYSDLRADLEAARHIPDHQLSNDRLRDAILRQGLKPEAAKSKVEVGWLWNAAAACGVVVLLVAAFGRHRSPSAPVVDLGNPNVVAQKIHFDFPLAKISKGSSSWVARKVAPRAPHPEEIRGVIVALNRQTAPHLHHARLARRTSETYDPKWLILDQASQDGSEAPSLSNEPLVADALAARLEAPQGAATVALSAKTDSGPVVEIDMDKDKDTGARAAREIESSSVIVGG